MRWLFLPLVLATPAAAEIRSAEDCAAAVAADPAAAREAAAVWHRLGGGVPARLCEADALAAMGAHAHRRAAPDRGSPRTRTAPSRPRVRAVVLADGAGQWLAAGRPDLARAALAEADKLTPPDAARRPPRRARRRGRGRLAGRPGRARGRSSPPSPTTRSPTRSSPRRCATSGDPAAALAEAETRPRARPATCPRRCSRPAPRWPRPATAPAPPRLWLAADRGSSRQRRSPPSPAPTSSASTEPRHRPGARVAHHRVGVRRQPPRRRQRAPRSPELPIA